MVKNSFSQTFISKIFIKCSLSHILLKFSRTYKEIKIVSSLLPSVKMYHIFLSDIKIQMKIFQHWETACRNWWVRELHKNKGTSEGGGFGLVTSRIFLLTIGTKIRNRSTSSILWIIWASHFLLSFANSLYYRKETNDKNLLKFSQLKFHFSENFPHYPYFYSNIKNFPSERTKLNEKITTATT